MPEQPLESIVLYDEDENEIEVDSMDKLGYKGETYYVLLPVDYDSDDVEFVILRELPCEDGETALVGIDDEATLDAVFDEYKKHQNIQD